MEIVRDFIFLGSKITADGDCSHEIKRCLLLGRKAMTNLDSILKSRDITLMTKVRIVKAMESDQISRSVVSDSLRPHRLQYARPLCPSPSPGACSNPYPLSQWCHPTISPSFTFFSCPCFSQHQGVFHWVGSLHQHQSFQWILRIDSFRVDWFDLFVVQGTLKSLLQHHS